MALHHLSQTGSRYLQLATSGLLATIAITAISAFVPTNSVFAQNVNAKEQPVAQLFEPNQPNETIKDSSRSPLATCWTTDKAQNCSYVVSGSQSEIRLNQYSVEQLNALPNFEAPITRVVMVNVQF